MGIGLCVSHLSDLFAFVTPPTIVTVGAAGFICPAAASCQRHRATELRNFRCFSGAIVSAVVCGDSVIVHV